MRHPLSTPPARFLLVLLVTLAAAAWPVQTPAAAATPQTALASEAHGDGEGEFLALTAAADRAEESKTALMPNGERAVAIAAGGGHTCALTTGGGATCWGNNFFGQLGAGMTTIEPPYGRLTPVAVIGLGSGVIAIAGRGEHTCALTGGGEVKCWGRNDFGQLGDGTTTHRSSPVAVSGLSEGVSAIAAGWFHTCALTTGGGVVCWGANGYGQLGDGTTTTTPPGGKLTPVAVSGLGSGVSAIAGGGRHTCAVTPGGEVKCWGLNDAGQLGDGAIITTPPYGRPTPVAVSGLSGCVSAISGERHSCALTAGGEVICWGYNGDGQLGDGTTTDRYTPVVVSGLGSAVSAVAAGMSHTCALTTGGGAMCWGRNDTGQLGDGTTTQSPLPVAVSGLGSGVSAISAGQLHTCALTTGGGIKCWGQNSRGALGDGTTTSSYTPVDVPGFGVSVVYLPLLQR